jgi:membrane-associated protein
VLGQAFPGLQHNIEALILLIVAFSLVPMVFEWWRHKRKAAAIAGELGVAAKDVVDSASADPDPR